MKPSGPAYDGASGPIAGERLARVYCTPNTSAQRDRLKPAPSVSWVTRSAVMVPWGFTVICASQKRGTSRGGETITCWGMLMPELTRIIQEKGRNSFNQLI